MRVIIVSGLSGSGKSVALHVLEDLGYYSIDNLPVALLGNLADDFLSDPTRSEKIAIGIDARNKTEDLQLLSEQITRLEGQGATCEVLFLQADEATILKRYSETRRKHPLANITDSLREAIRSERDMLAPVVNIADLIIDTTRTSIYELRDLIRERVASRDPHRLSILIESFGYKHGIPSDADFVFDLRCLPNPYWQPKLRPQTGLDAAVIEYLNSDPLAQQMHDDIITFVSGWLPHFENFSRSYLTVAIGCTGGQHRSVFMAEKLAATLRDTQRTISVRHHELANQTGPLFS